MASRTRWTWVWVNSGSWWWTGSPGVLQFMGSQRVGHDWATELNWNTKNLYSNVLQLKKKKKRVTLIHKRGNNTCWLLLLAHCTLISSPKAALALRLRHLALPPELGINKCCLLVATSHNSNLKNTAEGKSIQKHWWAVYGTCPPKFPEASENNETGGTGWRRKFQQGSATHSFWKRIKHHKHVQYGGL